MTPSKPAPLETFNFQARAHVLKLLGDELIGSDKLAIFELVKNAYDADATEVTVEVNLVSNIPYIRIIDNGHGMSSETIKTSWFEIGTDFKRGKNRRPTEIYSRSPLGEKGVGRLAVHKLGSHLELITKSKNRDELLAIFNWPDLAEKNAYLSDTKIYVSSRVAETFKSGNTGTCLTITQLHRKDWKRGDIRALHRMITAITSPFDSIDSFQVTLKVPGHETWLSDMLTLEDILDKAHWKFEFSIVEGKFEWEYKFQPPAQLRTLKLQQRSSKSEPDLNRLELINENRAEREKIFLTPDDQENIGPIKGTFYVYLRRNEVLGAPGQTKAFLEVLNEQSGVRVYRDGVRVYNYGEGADDWLGLNAARINKPAEKMGTNSVIGAFELELDKSVGLREKTNREGFDENTEYGRFLRICRSTISFLDRMRRRDRESIEEALTGEKKKQHGPQKLQEAITDIRNELKNDTDTLAHIEPHLQRIETEYGKLAEIATSAGLAGMNLPLIFHELEREVQRLAKAIQDGESQAEIGNRIRHLVQLLDGFTPLVKKSQIKTLPVSKLVQRIVDINAGRFRAHNMAVSTPVLTGEDPDFEITGALNFYLSALNNLIDNAIYWTSRKKELTEGNYTPAIAIRTLPDWSTSGPCLALIDNGTGFSISAEEAVQPFVTDRAGGMGLGLYFTNLVMELQGGGLIITDPADLDLETTLDGAAIVLQFSKGK